MRWNRSRKKRALMMRSLGQVYVDVRVALLLRHAWCCFYCGSALTMTTLTADHIKPVLRGGEPTLDNLVAACRPCNTAKGDLSLDAFRARRGGARFWGERRCHEPRSDT